MIVQVSEFFHNRPERRYLIESSLLQKDNPIDVMIMEKLDKKAFTQEVYIWVDEYEESDPEFWEDPGISGKAIIKGNLVPNKSIILHIDFDC